MIILQILEHDLHASRQGEAVPLMQEIPASPEFLPSLVSSSRGEFLTSNFLVDDSRIRVGIFEYDSDMIDGMVKKFVVSSYNLSSENNWPNIFNKQAKARRAFDYIKKSSGLEGQPHICLVPRTWTPGKVSKFFGPKNLDAQTRKYRKHCRICKHDVDFPVFFSRSDMVGMYTQFMGGKSSILIHNIRRGMAFCPD